MAEFRYGEVEAALAMVTGTEPAHLGAFRARIRHLRNIGLPELAKPGSGRKIGYTPAQALEMLIALRLESIGCAPRTLAPLAQSIVRQSPHAGGSVANSRFGDMYVVIMPPDEQLKHSEKLGMLTTGKPASPYYESLFGTDILAKFEEKAPDVFSRINISSCARQLFGALALQPANA